ncbi:MAG: DUF2892 domain-containing protein [Chloroherpetonaceae bacterium]|nr:DUF2892 domain-containing protein [Chloroherpetonaceae bacterium]MCS7211204.1 DUF2892 domain-containing protein [Chloroherpetonaceae bacterium]MDW8019055.1 DUF2892 domain-containing protein [Chloroherpetonaceae bacterium]MDW8465990.1 DUF2892 domain-containing protein [Chloroherpetonaceae bacterium]
MKPNIGKTDKIIRYALGGLIVGASIYYGNWWGIIVGVILAVTATISFCPLYAPFKISTLKEEGSTEKK